ncbi:MAG: homoserine kinase [Rhizobiaceae bacterium]|nr:homoserine kinase [Rhizobiaceae bacterium]
MAVYTTITDADVCAFLLQYDIGELQSLKGIAEGIQNSNFLLSTSKGLYILTLYEQMVEEKDLPFYLGLMEHLSSSGINCPRPMKMKNGDILSTLCKRPAAIVSFLNGVSVSKPQITHTRQVGKILARMHLAAADFSLALENPLRQANWHEVYAKSQARVMEIDKNLPQTIERELTFLASNWLLDLPNGTIHADLFPDNVFFLDGTLSGVIDFYFAANDLLAFDLAICINAWCFEKDGSFNRQKSHALFEGYQSVRNLSAAEIAAMPVLCRGASMRFLLTRIYDWLNVPPGAMVTPHDPIEYLKRLQFHQTITDADDYQ